VGAPVECGHTDRFTHRHTKSEPMHWLLLEWVITAWMDSSPKVESRMVVVHHTLLGKQPQCTTQCKHRWLSPITTSVWREAGQNCHQLTHLDWCCSTEHLHLNTIPHTFINDAPWISSTAGQDKHYQWLLQCPVCQVPFPAILQCTVSNLQGK